MGCFMLFEMLGLWAILVDMEVVVGVAEGRVKRVMFVLAISTRSRIQVLSRNGPFCPDGGDRNLSGWHLAFVENSQRWSGSQGLLVP